VAMVVISLSGDAVCRVRPQVPIVQRLARSDERRMGTNDRAHRFPFQRQSAWFRV